MISSGAPSAAVTATLEAGDSHYTWVAAAVDSESAAGYQLATGRPVMAIGGFNGTDPDPTLATFETYVAEGRVHYFIASGQGGTTATSRSDASAITAWVESHFKAETVGGTTLYDLSTSK